MEYLEKNVKNVLSFCIILTFAGEPASLPRVFLVYTTVSQAATQPRSFILSKLIIHLINFIHPFTPPSTVFILALKN
jgi:hypothetical protein